MSKQKEWILDYRFIVKADEDWLASNKLEEFLPEATDDIWYTIIRKVEELSPWEKAVDEVMAEHKKSRIKEDVSK